MTKVAWWDMDKRGRRLEKIFKHMETKFWKAVNEGEDEAAESYFHRMIQLEKTIQPYVHEVTGLRRIIALHDRKFPELRDEQVR